MQRGRGGERGCCRSPRQPKPACRLLPSPAAALRPLPRENVLLRKQFLRKKKPNHKPKWLKFALPTALPLITHEESPPPKLHSAARPWSEPVTATGAALAFNAPSKSVPKTWSRATLCYQRPCCPSPCRPTSVAARNLLCKKFMGCCQPPWSWL